MGVPLDFTAGKFLLALWICSSSIFRWFYLAKLL